MWSGWYGSGYGRGRGAGRGFFVGQWPGRGPFSHLPPWQRPGWVYGRGACWRFLWPWLMSGYGSSPPAQSAPGYGYLPLGYPGYPQLPSEMTKEEEQRVLGEELSALEGRVEEIKKRLAELKK